VYAREFKAEATALARRREKPMAPVAGDLEIGGATPRRWTQCARETAGEGSPPLPGHGLPRDGEPARPRKEVKALGSAA
jgi:transposase-like protein